MKKYVALPDGEKVVAIGQGTWYLGESAKKFDRECEALSAGISAGMTLIDTAEMYADGGAERLLSNVIDKEKRENLFIVSKVYPHNAGRGRIERSCRNSLNRLKTDYLDLYLLHWRGSIPLRETVECMEELVAKGLIRRWGVSNFDTDDMEELFSVPGGENCAVNQVLYHMGSRGIEFDLLPWMRQNRVPLMAYCPLGQADWELYENPVIQKIASEHGVSVSQVLLAFVIRDGNTIAIPRTGNALHAKENALADKVELTQQDYDRIEREFPSPKRKVSLDIR